MRGGGRGHRGRLQGDPGGVGGVEVAGEALVAVAFVIGAVGLTYWAYFLSRVLR
jgi:hypothetical protein